MAEEVITRVEFVIDGNGLVKTTQAIRSMDKYMEQLQRRAQMLARMQFSTAQRALERIAVITHIIVRRLQMLTRPWIVTVNPNVDLSLFSAQGAAAGSAFADSFKSIFITETQTLEVEHFETNGFSAGESFEKGFRSAFSIDALSQEIKESLEGITVQVNVKAEDSGGIVKTIKELFMGAVAGVLGNYATKGLSKVFSKIRGFFGKKPPTPPPPGGGGPHRPAGGAAAQSKVSDITEYRNKKMAGRQSPASLPAKPDEVAAASKIAKRTIGMDQAVKGSSKWSVSGIAKSAFKLGGKIFKPLGTISNIAGIVTAKDRSARKAAIGSTLGDLGGMAAGAAIGSMIFPGVGSVVGGIIGGFAGSAAGKKLIGKVPNLVGGLFGKKRPKNIASSPPAPPKELPAPSVDLGSAAGFYAASYATSNYSGTPSQPASPPPIHVHLPVGAVQLKVEERLDYDKIAEVVGSKISASIQRTMENRALSV